MEPKKNPKYDLTRKSSLFFNIGLVVSLLLVVVAFEWKSYDEVSVIDNYAGDEFEEIIDIPITEQPPPPPPQEIPKQPEIIEVPDEEEIEETPPIQDMSDINTETVVDIPIPAAPPVQEERVQEIFDIVEEEAQPRGGMKEFYEFLYKNIEYPRQAIRLGIEGTAYVRFVIDEKGNVESAEVVEGRELGYGLDEEAIRVIKLTKWTPGKQRGRAVKQRKILPVKFKLQK
ncbi:TonB family protein [Flammeovirgaceae bacterium 311]|nr:TonB family protein [Flammeovirgaceae bacterium 311]